MATRTEIAARTLATQKRLAPTSGPRPYLALRRLSARELFPLVHAKIQESRPVIGQNRGAYKRDKTGRKRYFGKPTPILGAPTFRNVIDTNGAWV